MAKTFRRSSRDKVLAGVCGGLAETLEMEPIHVRAFAVVLLLFTSAPIVLAYVAAAVFVPTDTSDAAPERSLAVNWQADGLRVSWKAAIAPHSVSWPRWIGTILATLMAWVFGTVTMAAVAGALGASMGDVGLGAQILGGLIWPLSIVAGFGGLLPRPYALTVTHDALWIERPLRRVKRIDLADVVHFDVRSRGVEIELGDRSTIRMPSPPEANDLDDLKVELERGQRRALEYQQDLSRAAPQRRELEALQSSRES